MELIYASPSNKAYLRRSEGAAGYDIFAGKAIRIPSSREGTTFNTVNLITVDTGIRVKIPEGYWGLVKARSSAMKKALEVTGVVDNTYRGVIYLVIKNVGSQDVILAEDISVAQLILIKSDDCGGPSRISEKAFNALDKTTRGDGAFGSTGGAIN